MTTWTTRPLAADRIEAGDVLADKAERLWAVTSAIPSRNDDGSLDGEVVVTVTRGEADKVMTFAADRPVPVLLTDADDRAIELIATELGGQTIERVVA